MTLFEEIKRFKRLNFRPELLLSTSLDNLNKLQKFISDDSDYEAQFAYGKEIFDDFNYNVGRKMHVIKSTIKVWKMLTFPYSHKILQVWSCLTGSVNYHEKKLFELAKSIKLMETVQNYLPVFPSPILQEMFKQTTFNKIKSLELEEIFYYTDLFLGYLKTQLII